MNPKLKPYCILVDFLDKMLGSNYEIVLHDLSINNGEIVKIANGEITGRKVGGSLTEYGKKCIENKIYLEKDYDLNYHVKNKFDKIIRTCALFIKDDNNELEGLLVISFDDSKFLNLNESLLRLIHPKEVLEERKKIENHNSEAIEVINESLNDVIISTINDIFIQDTNVDLKNESNEIRKELITYMSTQTRYNIIKDLEEKGIFFIKGAVNEVANQLYCSVPSVYRYLTIVKEEKNEQ
ncbi:MAG: PAS domain-containing protein [Bacilli bacterium]|jgi:predicted transcriptional regulator YheO|nr:PAS domain-containing protein [Bacilli bacterium]